MAVVAGVIYVVINRKKPAPAYIGTSIPNTQNHFKEELAMEKETEVIKEKVKSAEKGKMEKVASSKVEVEVGEELTPLTSQLLILICQPLGATL